MTFFSGFGLGTLLMPVFAIFFPVSVAVAFTSLVHFSNNLFKLALMFRHVRWAIVLRFGLPAVASSVLGARLLVTFSNLPPLASYELLGREFHLLPVKLAIAVLMVVFALFEIVPSFTKLSLPARWLPFGGLLSGFFGGLSGHQGALRSVFLIRCGLTKESFVATGVVIACFVDSVRIAVYGAHLIGRIGDNIFLLTGAVLSAFAGALIGRRLIKKVTVSGVQRLVSILLFAIALGLGAGLI